ncbi:HsdM family class I SAM-dependent methyltransferase [Stenotrophomonas lactitubi]|uniref:HsdM family class I SAM-dependent methyltransferase n=1 Tax=Stenotrophomonas lactitubi TaxID=2045214 RepID=UPI002041A779|nr:N-6 DNA methylase [Stenotrophomonas lactitubi]
MSKTPSRNERTTESLVRALLTKNDYADNGELAECGTLVEEQASTNAAIAKLLRAASKSAAGGIGRPEFIISNRNAPDILVVIECKASIGDHESDQVDTWIAGAPKKDDAYFTRARRYAVDGVLHYANSLSKAYTIIAIAASGQKKSELKFATFLWPKGATTPRRLLNSRNGSALDKIVPWGDFVAHATHDPLVNQAREKSLMDFARDLHNKMRVYKLTEQEKPLLVSGTLLALKDDAFRAAVLPAQGHTKLSPERIQQKWKAAIKEVLEDADIHQDKFATMLLPYSSLASHTELRKVSDKHPHGVMLDLIEAIDEQVFPFMSSSNGMDILGKFYGEFLRYTAGDKKGLGIVLTPRHITDLFAELAGVNHKTSVVLDPCAGTGGFLISAMARMVNQAASQKEIDRVKSEGLVGVEQQPHMFALAASNMILRGDGKANLWQGSCYDEDIMEKIRERKPNVGMINPPYAQVDKSELAFIEHMLDMLEPGGVGIAIVPMSAGIKMDKQDIAERESILSKHTLEAAMSMPSELFYPVGTVVSIMVFTAHKPHADSDRDTWFGYWRDDGFVKSKLHGRYDGKGHWDSIRKTWVDAFKNRKVIPGLSILQKVSAKDEWCAEAYMETDYSTLTKSDFEEVMRNFALFRLANSIDIQTASNPSPSTESVKV